MFQHVCGVSVFCVYACVFVCYCTCMQYIGIQVPKMLQPPSPRRHPHVLCSLASLIPQRSLTRHHTDMRENNIACLPSSPQGSHMLRRNAAYECCHLLSSISALFVLINLTVPHRVCLSGGITLDPPTGWLQQLVSLLVLNRDNRENKDGVRLC